MTRQIVLRHKPLLANPKSRTNQKSRFAEVAGGTTAECAAVCCCCPCGLVNLLILAMYKVPAGLFRKALKKKNGQSLKNGALLQRRSCNCGSDETESHVQPVSIDLRPLNKSEKDDPTAKEVLDLEKEMWDRFYGTGFWRSPSQRE